MKILCPKLLSNVFVKTFLFIGAVILISFSALFFGLKKSELSLVKFEPILEFFLSDKNQNIDLILPKLYLRDNNKITLNVEKVIARSDNSISNFYDIRIDFPNFSLRPSSVDISHVDFKASEVKDDDYQDISSPELLSPKYLYEDFFSRGSFSNIENININNINIDTYIPYEPIKYLDIKNGKIFIKHNKNDKKLNIMISGDIKSRILKQKTNINAKYNDNTGITTLDLHLSNYHKKIIQNNLGFTGETDIKVSFQSDHKIGIQKAIINIKSDGGELKLETENNSPKIKITKLDSTFQYFPQEKKMMLLINEIKSNQGSIKGSALLHKISENRINLALKGQIKKANYNGFFQTPITLDNINIAGFIKKDTKEINLEKIRLNPQDVDISGKALFKETSKGFKSYYANLDIKKLNKNNLIAIWPIKLPGSARSWASENIENIDIGDGSLFIKKDIKQEIKLSFKIPFNNAKIHYRKPMHPLDMASGNLYLNEKSFYIDLIGGNINNVKLSKAKFTIPDINSKIPIGKISSNIDGSTENLLEILDRKPLELFAKNNMSYKNSNGKLSGFLNISLPLLNNVKMEEINFGGKIDISESGINIIKKKYRFTNLEGTINLKKEGLNSTLKGYVNNQRFTTKWQEFFSKKSSIDSKFNIYTNLSHNKVEGLHLPISDYFQGIIKTNISLNIKSGRIKSLYAKGNAKTAEFKIPFSNYSDPKGNPKTITVSGYENRHGDLLISKLDLESENTKVNFKNMVVGDDIKSFRLEKLTAQGITTNLKANWNTINNIPNINISTNSLNIEPFIKHKSKKKKHLAPLFKSIIKAKVGKIIIDKDNTIKEANIKLTTAISEKQTIDILGDFKNSDLVTGKVIRVSPTKNYFSIEAKNAGNFLKSYKNYKHYTNGILHASGHIISDKGNYIEGAVKIRNGMLHNAPTAAKLFSLASMTGIIDRLSSDGVDIDKIRTDFIKRDNKIRLSNGVISGSGLGMSFKGDYYLNNDIVDLSGTLVPLYDLNSFISHIPLIGDILTSREGEGIIGMTYTLKGKKENPEISVNPLSALTPGIFRRIFD